RCERREAVYDPDQGCVVRYAIELCDRTGRPLERALASARLFPSARSARQHFETRLRPLAAGMRGRPEVAAFLAPAALLEPLSMTVTLFPIDTDLPTLVAATEPTVMLEILRGALERGNRAPFAPLRCRVDVAHYPRQHHCVLRYTLEGEGDAPRATVIEALSPGLGSGCRGWLASVKALAAASGPLSACFSHGGFSPSQLLFSSDQCSLIDFDTICQAERALDLGQFLAYLRLGARKAGEPASAVGPETTERVCARFVDAYVRECGLGPGAESLLRRRVRLYELVSLLRLVFHSWRKFKGERLAFAVELVRDRLGALAGPPT